MLARIPRRTISVVLLLMACVALVSCASEKKVTLVNDPDARAESQMPWNKQEKWESESQYGGVVGVTDHR